jgi:hypothetical protein
LLLPHFRSAITPAWAHTPPQWYTVLEVAVLAAVGCFNVFALSSMFKGPVGGRFGYGGRIVV